VLLVHVNTHGKKFFVTGGSHVCSDDFFKAQALIAREEELEAQKETKVEEDTAGKVRASNEGDGTVGGEGGLF
jgi:hypothetical protein